MNKIHYKIVDQALTSGIPFASRADQRDPVGKIIWIFRSHDPYPTDPTQIPSKTRYIPGYPVRIPGPPPTRSRRPDPFRDPAGSGICGIWDLGSGFKIKHKIKKGPTA